MAASKDIYRTLLGIEARHSSPKEGLAASMAAMGEVLKSKKLDYDEFVFSL